MATATRLPEAEPWRRRLYLPAYSLTDAARYAHTARQTVTAWYYGRPSHAPVLGGKERQIPLSYLQLVEVAFVATFRHLGVSLQRIRQARDYLAQLFHDEYPFAQRRLLTEGSHVLLDLQEIDGEAEVGRLIVADAGGQLGWRDLIADRFAEFDYEQDLALRWHVAGRGSAVLIDPRTSFGAPAVHGIPTWAILGRWRAGEPLDEIADDFDLSLDDVREALRFEGEKPEPAADPVL